MKNPLSDYQLSFNHPRATRIGIDKLQFDLDVLPYVEQAIKKVFEEKSRLEKMDLPGNLAHSVIPFTAYRKVIKAFKKYDNTKGKYQDIQLLICYRHIPLGVISEDIPRTIQVCPECKIKLGLITPEPEIYPWYKRLVQRFFKEAFREPDPVPYLSCATHGKVSKPMNITY